MNQRRLAYREVVGERLRELRLTRGMSKYQVAKKGGIRIDQVEAVESGSYNYTVDALFGYICGAELFLFFETKEKGGIDEMTRLMMDRNSQQIEE